MIAAFMVVMLACVWAALRYQAAKIRAMDEARHAAWAAALKHCDGSDETIEDIGDTADMAGTGPLPSTKQADEFLNVRAGSLAKDSGHVDLTKKRMVSFPKLMGGQSYELRSRMYLRCNEPSPPETAKDLFMTAVGVSKFKYGF